MLDEKQQLAEIINLGFDLTQIRDLDVLLETILSKARSIVNADAGSIYIKEGDRLQFKYTQNDTQQKKLPAGKKLIYSTFSIPINNQSIAGYVANCNKILNLPDVYALPSDLPFSFDANYDKLSAYHTQSMLACPLKDFKQNIVGVIQLINAKNKAGEVVPFKEGDEQLLIHFSNNAAIAIERAQLTRDIILRMIKMSELRDPKETGPHVNRVAAYAVEIYDTWATKKGIDKEKIAKDKDVLRMAAMLHDVGKIAISDLILKKPAKLSEDEYEIMKQHTVLGARLFLNQSSDFDEAAYLVALNHHEKWDGSGYPGHIDVATGEPLPGHITPDGKAMGKKGEEIHPFGRIVAIADVYDALSHARAYKEAWTEQNTLAEIKQASGKHFDPEMVEAFLFNLDAIKAISEKYSE
jgi:HD-GYP domain-containing protein (c-di-GMP phosphodiesterase class II)